MKQLFYNCKPSYQGKQQEWFAYQGTEQVYWFFINEEIMVCWVAPRMYRHNDTKPDRSDYFVNVEEATNKVQWIYTDALRHRALEQPEGLILEMLL